MKRWGYFLIVIFVALISCDKNPGAPQSGDIEGVVIDMATSNPVSGAVVSLNNEKDTTGTDGKYLFSGVKTGTYILNAAGTGYTDYADTIKISYGYNYFKIAMTQLPVPENPYGTLSGKVLETGTNQPVPGALIEMDGKIDTTTQDGKYQIDSLQTGSGALTVTATGYTSYAQEVTINKGSNNLDIALAVKNENVGSLSGIIYESGSGAPVSSAIVEIDNKKDTTGQDGKFSFSQIDAGSYMISVTAVDYDKASQPVTIAKGQNNVNIMLVAVGNLSGTVTEEGSHKSLAGVSVQLNEKISTTNQNGSYSLEDIPAGTYNLTAKLDLYNDFSQSITIKKGDNKLNLQLTAKRLYTNIYGNVTNGLGNPVQGALIELAGNQQITPGTGFYQFPSVPQGMYQITVTKDGYEDFNQSLNLASPDFRYDIQMTMKTVAPPDITGISRTGTNNITLKWNPVDDPNIAGYAIYNISDTTAAINANLLDPKTSAYEITNALPGIYSLRMASLNLENKAGSKGNASDTTFVYQEINGDDFESRRLDPAKWVDNNFDYTIISDSKYVIDGTYSLMYMGGAKNIFSSATILPSQQKYISVAKVMFLSPASYFSMELTNGQSTGTNPAIWLETDSNGNVKIGYKENATDNMYPFKSYGSYQGQIFKIGLFVDTMAKKFSIVVDDVAIFTKSYTRDNLDTLSMHFVNRQIIDDIVIGSVQ
ncbi:MAG TPA: carboxypeptidase regulatory-like domain-containing protein [Balneolales bacterium]|nr:carboxypeptidase regulatory-like domain-containing protein [Balneolales bacterium]